MKKSILTFILMLLSLFSLGQTAQEKQRVKNQFIRTAKEFNQQLPMYVDDYTTLTSVTFINWVWTYNLRLAYNRDDFTRLERYEILEEIKKGVNAEQRRNVDAGIYNMTRAELRWFMKQVGLKFKYNYLDINGAMFGTFTLTHLNF